MGSIQKMQVESRLKSDMFPTNQIRGNLREKGGFLLCIQIEISAHVETKYLQHPTSTNIHLPPIKTSQIP